MRSLSPVALCLLLAAFAPALRPPSPADSTLTARAAQQARFEALVRSDLTALDTLLADDLIYTHSSAAVETKQQFLDNLRGGALRYLAIEPSDVAVRLHGDAAVLTGRVQLRVLLQAQELDVAARFTEVHVLREGRWRLLAWQSTRLPD